MVVRFICSSFLICLVCLYWNRFNFFLHNVAFKRLSLSFNTFRGFTYQLAVFLMFILCVFFRQSQKRVIFTRVFCIRALLSCVRVWLCPAGGGLWKAMVARPSGAVSEGMASFTGVPGSAEAQSIDFSPPLTFPCVCLSFHHNSVQTNASNWKHIFSLSRRRTHMCRNWHTDSDLAS